MQNLKSQQFTPKCILSVNLETTRVDIKANPLEHKQIGS